MTTARLTTTLRSAMKPRITSPISLRATRQLHQSRALFQDNNGPTGGVPDALAEGNVKGRTGGGEKLDSSSENAPPKPKISNLSVPGSTQTETLTEEQKKEVEEHNKDFEAKHDRGSQAPDDKVDKKFWRG